MTTATRAAPPPPHPGTTAHPLAELAGLTKRYGARTAVDRVDLTLHPGQVTGLIGPNGAGKTTVLAMLLGLVRPTAGSGTVLGHDLSRPGAYLPGVGALIDGPAFPPGATAREALTILATLGGHQRGRVEPVLHTVGLGGRERDRVGSYSLGMRQRLGIAAALLPDPALVVLDEPGNGLDPAGLMDLRRSVRRMASDGRAVLLSSHLLAELEQVCDRVVVMLDGRVRFAGRSGELPRSRAECLDVSTGAAADLPRLARLADDLGSATIVGDRVRVTAPGQDLTRLATGLNTAAHAAGIPLCRLEPRHTDLESRYLELISEER